MSTVRAERPVTPGGRLHTGLSNLEAELRHSARGPLPPLRSSRSYSSIVRGQRLHGLNLKSRRVATTALVGIGLYFVLVLEAAGRKRCAAVSSLVLSLAGRLRDRPGLAPRAGVLRLAPPSPAMIATALGGSALVLAGLWLADPGFAPGRAHAAEG